ncbi:hypothetical protein CPB85DRAFT_1253548 [Mucidula mucida]|nr:hypothetical protein CPB85DRAFT_1253548 [Mucidula mucida]
MFSFSGLPSSFQEPRPDTTQTKRSRGANTGRNTRSKKRQRTSPPPHDESPKDIVASRLEAEAAAGPSASKASTDSHETKEATSSNNDPKSDTQNDVPDAESPPPGDTRSSWKPYKEFYFVDGDIILRACNNLDNTIFRVHRHKLLALGGFFADVLQVPQPQCEDDDRYDDCQILALPFDFVSSFDIIQLLKYIYHETIMGGTVECEWPHGHQEQRFMVNVDMALSLALMGRTLSLGRIRNEAVIMIRHIFPFNVDEYNDPELLFTGPSSAEEREFTRKTYTIRAIRVFNECDLFLHLPLATILPRNSTTPHWRTPIRTVTLLMFPCL